ncbi:hypothetical protein NL676_036872 [Syzygium grande]|nr:hypothetical protein NL676_036872 [Syzygium grande]
MAVTITRTQSPIGNEERLRIVNVHGKTTTDIPEQQRRQIGNLDVLKVRQGWPATVVKLSRAAGDYRSGDCKELQGAGKPVKEKFNCGRGVGMERLGDYQRCSNSVGTVAQNLLAGMSHYQRVTACCY